MIIWINRRNKYPDIAYPSSNIGLFKNIKAIQSKQFLPIKNAFAVMLNEVKHLSLEQRYHLWIETILFDRYASAE
jgi:hypothetical protein